MYVDYLLSSEGHISCTDLSAIVGGQYSHDQITRMLSSGVVDDKVLYRKGKHFIKAKGTEGVVTLSLDDSIQTKPYSEVNGLVGWHYDHTAGWCVKGINFVAALWSDNSEISVPLSIQLIKKEWVWNEKKGKHEWKALQNKNELFGAIVQRLTRSKTVDYVLCDSWYSSKENINSIIEECETNFIMALKCNRDAKAGNFKPLQDLKLGEGAGKVYIKGVDFPLLVIKKVFKNADGSSGTL